MEVFLENPKALCDWLEEFPAYVMPSSLYQQREPMYDCEESDEESEVSTSTDERETEEGEQQVITDNTNEALQLWFQSLLKRSFSVT